MGKELEKGNVLESARDLINKLAEQAQEGQVDGALIDQAKALLNVGIDSATDAQSDMKSDANGVTSVTDATTPSPSIPDTSSLVKEGDESTTDTSTDTETDVTETTPETDMTEKMENAPRSARGPVLILDKTDEYEGKLGDFVKYMESGQMKMAQQLAGDSRTFDKLFNMAQHAILNEGGWTQQNMAKIAASANMFGVGDPNDMPGTQKLGKGLTASTVPGIYLIRLAKLMLPVYAGLIARFPSTSPDVGSDNAIWKAQLGFGSINEASFFRIAEASIGVEPPSSFLEFKAPYRDITANDNVTLKAIRTSKGYSDPLQIAVITAMSAVLRAQERVFLGQNSAAIAATTSVTATAGSTGGSLSGGSVVVAVTALTYEGWLAASKGGSAAVGESTATTSSAMLLTGSSSSIAVTWPAVEGAVAYNVYLTAAGTVAGSAAKWNKMVTINKATVVADSTATTTPPAADTTANTSYGYEGLLSWCMKSTVYGNAIPNKATIYDVAGAGLTTGNGGIVEIDAQLASLWTNWHIAPSLMVMSPNMNATCVGKVMALGSGNFYRVDVSDERNKMNGGLMMTGYVNKFAPFADGTPRMIDIIPHPYLPDGTILMASETIPYPMGNETRGFVRDVLLPYTYFPLPSQAAGVNKIRYDFAITTSEVVECFNPAPQTAIVGIDYTK